VGVLAMILVWFPWLRRRWPDVFTGDGDGDSSGGD
jgi:hypothetical protein